MNNPLNTVHHPRPTRPSSRLSARQARRGARTAPAVATLAAALLLAGCGQATAPSDAAPSAAISSPGAATTDSAATGAPATEAVAVTDPWAKATDEHMTSVFAVLENTSGQDVTLTGASADVAGTTELHETVDDGSGATVMQAVEAGFTIPAGGRLELVPGGNHLMLMELQDQVAPGDPVELELQFEDGRTQVLTATAKEFAGAQEDYGGTDEMDHGHEDHEGHGGH